MLAKIAFLNGVMSFSLGTALFPVALNPQMLLKVETQVWVGSCKGADLRTNGVGFGYARRQGWSWTVNGKNHLSYLLIGTYISCVVLCLA